VTHAVERRFTTSEFEVRSLPNGGVQVEGHAAVFNRHSQDLGGFVEQVAPGAFKKTIQEADVRALYNHDPSMVLGRNKSGTLRLSEDNVGLHYQVDLPDTTYARDLAISMERGDVSQSSFGFRVIPGGDGWGFTEQDYPLRTLGEVQLMDVSPVTYPAYLDADSGIAGRALTGLAKAKGYAVEAVQADLRAAIAGTLGTAPAPVDATPGIAIESLRALMERNAAPLYLPGR
jgi:HK97 family phage prohead protease